MCVKPSNPNSVPMRLGLVLRIMYHRLNKFYLFMLMVLAVLLFMSFLSLRWAVKTQQVMPDAIVFTKGLYPVRLYPLSEKAGGDDIYKNLFVKCAYRSLDLDPDNYRVDLIKLSEVCFTQNGFKSFRDQLFKNSGIMDSVKNGEIWTVKRVRNVEKVAEGLAKKAVYFETYSAVIDVARIDTKRASTYINDYKLGSYKVKAMIVRQIHTDYEHGVAITKMILE
jgi:hypothetical protein